MATTVQTTITLTPGTHVLRFDLLDGWMTVQPIVVANAAKSDALGEAATSTDTHSSKVVFALRSGEGVRSTESGVQEWYGVPPFGSVFSDKVEDSATSADARAVSVALAVQQGEGATVTDQVLSGLLRLGIYGDGVGTGDAYDNEHFAAPKMGEYFDVVTTGDAYGSSATLAVQIAEGSIADFRLGQGTLCDLVVSAEERHRKNQLIDCNVAITNLTTKTVVIQSVDPSLIPLDSGWGSVGVVSDPSPTDYAFYRVTYKLKSGSTVVYRWSVVAFEAGDYEVGVTVTFSDDSSQYGSTTIRVQGYQ